MRKSGRRCRWRDRPGWALSSPDYGLIVPVDALALAWPMVGRRRVVAAADGDEAAVGGCGLRRLPMMFRHQFLRLDARYLAAIPDDAGDAGRVPCSAAMAFPALFSAIRRRRR